MNSTIILENETVFSPDFDLREVALSVVNKVLESEGFPVKCEINISVTDNEGIREVNKEFRQIDSPTDVLSFPAYDFCEAGNYKDVTKEPVFGFNVNQDTGNFVLGDILLSYERIISQAEEYGHAVKREYAFLIAHSMLHLLGYDHMTEDEARVMEDKQRTVLEELGITR